MIAGIPMNVYFTQSNGRGVDSQIIDLTDLHVLEHTLCPGLQAAEMLDAAIAQYAGKIDIENCIVSNGTVWIEGYNQHHRHVIIPIH